MNDAQRPFVPTHGTIEQARTKISWFVLDHGLPLLCYSALAILLTWPLARYLGDELPAAPGEGAQDLWQNVWNLWWAGAALQRGQSPFFTDALFYPQGASLLFHPLNLTSGLLAMPLRAVAGTIAAYNILVLLSFVLSGYAVFLLASKHGCSPVAALLGGLAYTASAFHFFHLRVGHLEQISMQWLPLYALALDALLTTTTDYRSPTTDRPEPRTTQRVPDREPRTDQRVAIQHATRNTQHVPFVRVSLAALALLAVIFTSLYMAVYAAVLTGVWVMWKIGVAARGAGPRPKGRGRKRLPAPAEAGAGPGVRAALLALGVMILLTLAVAGPTLLLPMAREARTATYMVPGMEATALGAAAGADALLPPGTHPLRNILDLPKPFKPGLFLGYLPLILAIYGTIARAHKAGRWFALGLLAWALALGPALPLYRLLYAIPLLPAGRYPDRFGLLTLLAVALLAALGADALLGRLKGWMRQFATLLLLGLLLVELYPGPPPLTPAFDNPFYHTLARDPGQFSVFEMPINRANGAWVAMYAQTIHQHPILDGALARPAPRIPFEWLPIMRELEHPDRPADIVVQSLEARAAALRFFKLRYLIYHREDENGPVIPPPADALARVAGIPIRQVYADDTLVAYRLDPPDGPAALMPVATTGEGWSAIEAPGPSAHRWLDPSGASVQIYAPQNQTATLRLKLVAYQQSHRIDLSLDGQMIGQIEAPPWPSEVRTPPLQMRAGPHTLRLVPSGPGISPRAAGAGGDDRPLTVAVFELEIESAH